jgi:hypothetical protein
MRLATMAAVVGLAALGGCRRGAGAATEGPSAPPKAPTVRAVKIDPLRVGLGLGIVYQFSATVDADPDVDHSVRWSARPTPTGTITPSGLLTTCYPNGIITVFATSVVDSTKSDSLRVSMIETAEIWAAWSALYRPGAFDPVINQSDYVDFSAVSGVVDVQVGIHGDGHLACRSIEEYRMQLVSRADASVRYALPTRVVATPGLRKILERYRFDSRTVPNGEYLLTGIVKISGGFEMGFAGPMPIIIRNP